MNWEEIVERAKILIVDDEQVNVLVMQRMLEQAGYCNIVGTTDPRRVVALYEEVEPDLVILDLKMPDLDGFEVMERLQERIPEKSYLPILVLTADLHEASRLRALVLGAKDFMTKPVDRTEAMLRIRILLQTRFLFLELAASNVPPEGPSESQRGD